MHLLSDASGMNRLYCSAKLSGLISSELEVICCLNFRMTFQMELQREVVQVNKINIFIFVVLREILFCSENS